MSKAGSKKKHDEKMKERRAKKAQKAALYKSYAGTGKRAKRRAPVRSGATGLKGKHVGPCGNIGCVRCFPQFAAVPANRPQPPVEGRDNLCHNLNQVCTRVAS